MSLIARLGVVLGINSAEFVQGIAAAENKTKQFKKNLRETQETIDGMKTAFAAAGAAFVAFAAAAMNSADKIADLADANETTIGKVLELRSALIMSGGDASKVEQFYASFTKSIDGAAQGSDKLRDSFAAVGVSIKDIGSLSQQELQNKTLRGLANIDDQVRRNALGFELFGKAAKGVNFSAMAGNAENAAGSFKEQEKAMRAAADAAQKIEMFFGDMQIAALTAIKPVSDLINKIPAEDRIEAMTVAFQVLGTAIAVAFGVTAVGGVIKFASALATITAANPWLLGLAVAGGAAAYFGGKELFGGKPDDSKPNLEEEKKGFSSRSIEMSQRDKMIEKYKHQIALVKEMQFVEQANIQNRSKAEQELLDIERNKYAMSTNAYELEKLWYSMIQSRQEITTNTYEKMLQAKREYELAPADEKAMAEKLFNEKKRVIQENDLYEADQLKLVNDRRLRNFNEEIERQKSWSAGWDQAFKRYSETAEKASLRGEAAFESVVSNMGIALRNFVETGKLNFKDFVGDVVKELLYLEMKAQATMILRSVWGGITEALGMKTLPKKASGGYIDGPAFVGENGPELFIPRTPGTIIPQGSWQQMASSGGGGLTVNGNYIANMSAIDTQSATQFLASNKQTIWAAYQSANRMVPISR
jgi:lambda family phage tail tape measure protein